MPNSKITAVGVTISRELGTGWSVSSSVSSTAPHCVTDAVHAFGHLIEYGESISIDTFVERISAHSTDERTVALVNEIKTALVPAGGRHE